MKEHSINSIDLNRIESFDAEAYKNLDLNRLAVYGISFLQEKKIPVTFETLVVILFRIFPKKFSLVNFEEYPDATRVNRALLQLRPKYRNWATGDVKLGYSLTKAGRTEAERIAILLEKPHLQRRLKKAEPQRTLLIDAEMNRIEESKLYRFYKDGKHDESCERDVWNLLGAFPYTPRKALRDYINKLIGFAEYNKRPDIVEFLRWVKQKFAKIFKDVKNSTPNQKQFERA
jgi:hypothetical protein